MQTPHRKVELAGNKEMKNNLNRKVIGNSMLDKLIKAAKKENWTYIDKEIATIKNYEPFIWWAFPTGIHDPDPNLRDLGVSIIEKSNVDGVRFRCMRQELFKLMTSDPNPYVRYRSAFALAAHGVGIYSKQVRKVLMEAKKDKEVSEIAKQYLKKF
jgi:hypothetical protein